MAKKRPDEFQFLPGRQADFPQPLAVDEGVDVDAKDEKDEKDEPAIVAYRTNNNTYSKIPTWHRIPTNSRKQFVDLIRPICRRMFTEEGSVNVESLREFQSMPRKLLLKPNGNHYATARQLEDFLTRASLPSFINADYRNEINLIINNDDEREVNASPFKGAIAMALQGYAGKATTMAMQTGAGKTIVNADSIEKIRQLYIKRVPDRVFPSLPADSPVNMGIDPVVLRKILKTMDTGKAPGPSGWTVSHLRTIADDDVCCDCLCRLISHIINGTITNNEIDRNLIMDAKGVYPTKPDGGIRPLGLGETLRRVAMKFVLSSIEVAKLSPSGIQKGIGQPGGSATALHTAQVAYESGVANGQSTCVLAIDLRNAYGTRDTTIQAKYLYEQHVASPMWRHFEYAYKQPSRILLDNPVYQYIIQENGSQQGDTCGGTTFQISMEPLYQEMQNAAGPGVTCNAVVDDVSMVGAISDIERGFVVFSDRCTQEGTEINVSKCKLLVPLKGSR